MWSRLAEGHLAVTWVSTGDGAEQNGAEQAM